MSQIIVSKQRAIRKDNPLLNMVGKVLLYVVLIAVALFTLIPFVWMISSSLKLHSKYYTLLCCSRQ